MRHRDNKGNEGLLTSGSVQWMTAGRGIVHSEMPEQDHGLMRGFQLWLNLPAKDKMIPPRYQDIPPDRIPRIDLSEGVSVKLIAGVLGDISGPVQAGATEPFYADVTLGAGASASIPLAPDHAAFAYVYEGQAQIGDPLSATPAGHIAVLSPGDRARLEGGPDGARLILAAGKPLKEPVAKYGPFVMNTVEQLREAFADFQAGRF
jgi:redox-sensitive bicupin YhaK (pirin superfamily)